MPRIRTLKPESLQHRKVGRLSDRAFRLWVGMITQADDDGRLVADPEQLRVLVFGYQPRVSSGHVQRALQEIEGVGLCRLYGADAVQYADFPSWAEHQRISHKTDSKLPPYQDSGELRNIPEDSVLARARGSEGIGREGKGSDLSCAADDAAPAGEILDWLNRKAGKTFRPVETNLDLIRARLASGIHPWQLKAIVSRKTQEWRGTDQAKYLRPITLFNKSKCEQYLGELPPPTEESQ